MVNDETPSNPTLPESAEEDQPKDTSDDEADPEDADEASTAKPAAAVTPQSESLRQVHTAEAEAYAKECGLLFYEASAKTGQNVGEVFTEIGKSAHLSGQGRRRTERE